MSKLLDGKVAIVTTPGRASAWNRIAARPVRSPRHHQ